MCCALLCRWSVRNRATCNPQEEESEMTAQRSYETAGQITLNLALDDVYQAAATTASQFGGGSLTTQGERDPAAIEADLANWYPDLDGLVRERRAPELAGGFTPQVGPLDTGGIHFDGGVPVRGWAQLTLFETGSVNFTGHFHDSGATSYNVAFGVGVRSQRGVLYTFGRQGHMAGTFEFGSRDFNWNLTNEHFDVIRDDWANIAVNSTWWWNAKVNLDIAGVLSSVKTIAESVGAVGSVIALI
jgi:hypothetical protein